MSYNLQDDFLALSGKKVRKHKIPGKIGFIVGVDILKNQVKVKWGTMNQSRKTWVNFNDLEVLDI